MSTLQIDLDEATDEALTSLAAARGVTPAELVAEFVSRYVKTYEPIENGRSSTRLTAIDSTDAMIGSPGDDPSRRKLAPPDPLDAIVGSAGNAEPVDDIDEVMYGR